jgi:hypothetical protein
VNFGSIIGTISISYEKKKKSYALVVAEASLAWKTEMAFEVQ